MISEGAEFKARLEKKIQIEIDEKSSAIVSGAAETLEDYRERVGHVRGLKQALDLIAEVETQMKN